jgi:uncharacterized membrane protein
VRRLLRAIVNPAKIVVWLTGSALLALQPRLSSSGLLHVKLLCVILIRRCMASRASLTNHFRKAH